MPIGWTSSFFDIPNGEQEQKETAKPMIMAGRMAGREQAKQP